MADVFIGDVIAGDDDLIRDEDGLIGDMQWPSDCVKYAAHAINSHDELVRQRDHLLDAIRQTLAMLRTTSHGPSAANKAEDMLHAAICGLDSDHSLDAAKMVPGGLWQLVPVEPTSKMRDAFRCAQEQWEEGEYYAPDHQWQAMLAAAPKLGGE